MKEELPLHPTNQSDPIACQSIWATDRFLLLPVFSSVEYFLHSTGVTDILCDLTNLLSHVSLKTSALRQIRS